MSEDEVELYGCPTCYCLWHPNWPYDRCTDEKCWCGEQPDAWWHGKTTLVYWADASSEEPEEITGSDDETQKIPEVKAGD